MLLVEIVVFYLLHAVSAPAWCYIVNSVAVFFSLFHVASAIGSFIRENDEEADRCM